MKDNEYPKTIAFSCSDDADLSTDAKIWLTRIKKEVHISMPMENAIRIDYPTDLVGQVRMVNVDDTILRLDLKDPCGRFWMCDSIFPNLPWDMRRFMRERWSKGVRRQGDGCVTFVYPTQQ